MSENRNLNRDECLRVLGDEISHIREQEKKPGLNIWTLLAAVAALVWLLIAQVTSPDLHPRNVATLFLALSVLFDSCVALYLALSPKTYPSINEHRFRWLSSLTNDPAASLLSAARCVVVIILALNYSNEIPKLQVFYITALYASWVLLMLLSVTLTRFKIPLAIQTGGFVSVVLGATGLVAATASYFCFRVAFSSSHYTNVADVKTAALLSAIIFLVSQAVIRGHDSPLLGSLVAVRRALAFGQIDVDTAVRQADIALAGMRVDDVLQEEIQKVLTRYEDSEKRVDEITGILIEADSVFDAEDYKPNLPVFRQYLDQLGVCQEKLQYDFEVFKKRGAALDRLLARTRLLRLLAPQASEEIKQVYDRVQAAQKKLQARTEELQHRLKLLRQRYFFEFEKIEDEIKAIGERIRTFERQLEEAPTSTNAVRIRAELEALLARAAELQGEAAVSHIEEGSEDK